MMTEPFSPKTAILTYFQVVGTSNECSGVGPVDRVDVETSSDVVYHNILLQVIHINVSTV